MNERIGEDGIYLLDEPEAALSPQRQLSLLAILADRLTAGKTQFIVATHAPILMKYWLTVFASLWILATLPRCSDSAAGDCATAGDPQAACSPGTACAWTGEQQSACFPLCKSFDECAEEESCFPRQLPTTTDAVLSANVCFPIPLLEPPRDQEELEALRAECRARTPQSCGENPMCLLEHASKVDLERRCVEPMPVGCFALGISCTLSLFVAENTEGDLFIFSAGCGNTDFTGLALNLDDPLFKLLFEGESTVYDWPRCD